MRRLRAQPKDQRAMAIPDDLRDAMRQVHQLLRDAENDPDVVVDFGDAIQVDGLCGGRYRSGKRPFGFTYYPPDRDPRGQWYLTLHPIEIEDIADGVMTEIVMYCCTSPDCRTRFREPDEHCFFCDYYDDGITPTPKGTPKSAEELARAAEADARLTDATCPHCGQPCPSYRKTCKRCGKPVNGR
jgi:hypothetical protein